MFSLLSLVQSTDPTKENAYCIYVDKTDNCASLAKSLSSSTTTYTAINLKMKDVNTTSVTGTNRIVIFVQENMITSEQLLVLAPEPANSVYAYGCQVTVNVTANAIFKKIPLSLTYIGGPIVFTPTDLTLSHEEILKINIEIKLQSSMVYTVHDVVNTSLPSNFKVDETNSGSLSYTLMSENIDITRLIIDGDSCHWGNTTFAPGGATLKLLSNTIVSCTAKAPKTPVKVGGGCFFDETFKKAETSKEYAEVTTPVYVQDSSSVAYLKKESSVTATAYKVYCIHQTKKTEGCANSGFTELLAHEGVSDATVAEGNFVAFEGSLTIPDDKFDLLKRPLITKDATSITVVCDTAKTPDAGLDLRKPIWKLTKKPAPSGASILAAPIAITNKGAVNPKIINSLDDALALTASGLAITPENKGDVLNSTKVTINVANIPIVPYGIGDAKVEVKNAAIIVNGATVPVPKDKNIALQAIPGQNVELSQNGATDAFTLSVQSTGNVHFDESWNSVKNQIVSVEGGSVSTQFVGIPPFLNSNSVASQGVIQQPPPPRENEQPSKGLEGWAIAVIVIVCVIVVAVMVVVVLQVTGIIHLCGKKKVEV